MKKLARPELSEATRLTKAGRLLEATAVLQRLLTREIAARAPAVVAEAPPVLEAAVPAALLAPPDISAAIERPTRAARFLTASYKNAAGSRTYKLYVPSGYSDRPVPLIVMLHGCSQSPDDFAAGTRMNGFAEEFRCLVAYPAQSSSANPGKCWNWFRPGDQRRDEGEPSLIAGITRAIMSEYAVDASRVYVAGLSAGGGAAAVVAAAYPELYAALGVHSGVPTEVAGDVSSAFSLMQRGAAADRRSADHPQRATARAIPTIVFHGDRDTTVHPSNADLIVAQSAHAGLQTTVNAGHAADGHTYTQTLYADGRGRTLLENWTVHGAGHAWLGGNSAGSYTDTRGPDASREMVRFFLEHRLQ